MGEKCRTLAQLPHRAPLAFRRDTHPCRRQHYKPLAERIFTTKNLAANFQTIATPDGSFTIITDLNHNVLASGWTDDP